MSIPSGVRLVGASPFIFKSVFDYFLILIATAGPVDYGLSGD